MGLAAARSLFGSDSPPDCHSLPKSRFATHIVPKKCGSIVEKYIRNVPEIEKYIIMPDHIHMIIRIDNGTMWASSPTKKVENIVRSIKILTTKELGEALFQRSYHDHIIRNAQDYNEAWEYIENNPAKWFLSPNKKD
ncbi:MAG: transposase [Clostridia bacterium]|nr:transposase [Clostridia bacterium]